MFENNSANNVFILSNFIFNQRNRNYLQTMVLQLVKYSNTFKNKLINLRRKKFHLSMDKSSLKGT